MPVCFVPNCDSGYVKAIKRNKTNRTRNPSLFSPPKDPELFAKWAKQIPRDGLTVSDKVCSLHFSEKDIIKYDEIPLQNGTIYKSERKKYELVRGAYPTIFPNCPAYLTSVKTKRKSPKKRIVNSAGDAAVKRKKLRLQFEDNDCNFDNNSNFGNEVPTPVFDYEALLRVAREYVLPQGWTFSSMDQKGIMFIKWKDDTLTVIQKRINITPELKIKTFLYSKEISLRSFTHVQSIETFHNLMSTMDDIIICESLTQWHANIAANEAENNGTGFRCVGYVSPFIRDVKCNICRKRDRIKKLKSKISPQHFQNVKRRNTRLVTKVNKLMRRLERLEIETAKVAQEKLESQIAHLPENEREAVLACLQASKVKDSRGRRYTQKWLYRCVLLRIKNVSQYDYMRRNQILALPCRNSISRFIKNLKPHYGFDSTVFRILAEKSKHMPLSDRRGVLLLDEMKLTPYASLNKRTLEVGGFTSLGKYTPEVQENVLGDHGLVFIFQPFRGTWVQPIGAFLSKNAAPGHVLAELILECLVLLENAGFFVDAVVSDGAQWNRSMWKQFTSSTEQPWCIHPCNSEGENDRYLYFISDFPHLIKNLRNWVVDIKNFMTPDGEIQWKFWLNLLNIQNEMHGEFGLKDCFTLSKHHINPEHYEKMNVGLAYQLFGFDVACAMELHKDNKQLLGCRSTINFIHRLHSLIKAMTSTCRKGALWKNSDEEKTIVEFLKYLDDWKNVTSITAEEEKENESNQSSEPNQSSKPNQSSEPAVQSITTSITAAKKRGRKTVPAQAKATSLAAGKKREQKKKNNAKPAVLSKATKSGEEKTINSKENAKLTQANASAEDNEATNEKNTKAEVSARVKPFITTSAYVGFKATLEGTLKLFNYLSSHHGFLYLMTARLNQNNLEKFFGIIRSHCGTHDHPNSLLFIQLYRLLSVYSLVKPPKGTNIDDTEIISTLIEKDVPRSNSENDKKNHFNFMLHRIMENMNDSFNEVPDDTANESNALKRFAGYIAFKFVNRTECMDCKTTLLATSEEEIQKMKLILLQDKYDALYYPSKNLIHFVGVVEKHILKVARPAEGINKDFVFNIADSLLENEEKSSLPSLGCSVHNFSFSKSILNFLLTIRTHFILKIVNKNCVESAKTKKKRKQSKL